MDATFVDTGYILALVNTADKYHPRARATASVITPPFVTTEAVLIEIGNALSGLRWRKLAVDTLNALRTDPNIRIVTVDSEVFEQALTLYTARLDKEWGLTDCISFVVMQAHNLNQALTTDRHFEQAGFVNRLAKADG
jgi:predicted nucleic acid-binding protein